MLTRSLIFIALTVFTVCNASAMDPVPVPDPGSLSLIGLGLVGMFIGHRRKRQTINTDLTSE